jgi:hypothetical protein
MVRAKRVHLHNLEQTLRKGLGTEAREGLPLAASS